MLVRRPFFPLLINGGVPAVASFSARAAFSFSAAATIFQRGASELDCLGVRWVDGVVASKGVTPRTCRPRTSEAQPGAGLYSLGDQAGSPIPNFRRSGAVGMRISLGPTRKLSMSPLRQPS